MITFCLDFGNSRRKLGIFHKDQLTSTIYLQEDSPRELEKLVEEHKPARSILSSVIKHDTSWESYLSEKTTFHLLNHQSRLPFRIPVGKPETIGADRLAVCAAVVHFFPGKHNLVLSTGTCLTYNFINRQHEFLGGSISPGLEMRLKAMHQFTALLPLVKPSSNVPLIGYDTSSNLLSGAVLGMAREIDGMIESYAEKFSNFNVHLTGGDLAFLAPHLKNRIFADPELIFKGLYAISEANNP